MLTGRLTALVSVAAMLSVFTAACDGGSAVPDPPPVSPSSVASDEISCGMVDDDLVVEAIGADVKTWGEGILPPDQAAFRPMSCTIQNQSDSLTFMTIGIGIPRPRDLEAARRSWPTSVGGLDCPGAWLAPGANTYAAACVDDNAPPGAKSTSLTALSGKYSIAIGIVRPKPRATDAETAFRISQSVADHLPR